MRSYRPLLSILLLICISVLSVKVYYAERQKRVIKDDLIELSKIKYGLFSVDEWKKMLASIITKKIEGFNIDGANRQQMRKEISTFLYKQIGDLEQRYHEERSRSFIGFVQSGIASITGTFGEIKKNIPKFTDEIINFMNDPRNRKAIRKYIISKLDEYTDKTFSETDYSTHDLIISKYHYTDRKTALAGLSSKNEDANKQAKPFIVALLTVSALAGIFIAFTNKFSRNEFLLATLMCLVLLVTGLLLPMIEIDARIDSMNFSLLGESVRFEDQVLYYKSKSILEVVNMMFTQGRFDLILVGLLVVLFSVLFPIFKLLSSIALIYSDQLGSNRFIQFMVFKTGKWSMADVMVIAIFMSYIGFSGIITEQLKQIESITQNIDILTTNKSSLQAGFFAFTAFSVLSLLVSHKLQYGLKKADVIPVA